MPSLRKDNRSAEPHQPKKSSALTLGTVGTDGMQWVTVDSEFKSKVKDKITEYIRYENGSLTRKNPTLDGFKRWIDRSR